MSGVYVDKRTVGEHFKATNRKSLKRITKMYKSFQSPKSCYAVSNESPKSFQSVSKMSPKIIGVSKKS